MIRITRKKSDYFDVSSTGIPKYDELLNLKSYCEIKWMIPTDYVKLCAKIAFNTDYRTVFDSRFTDDRVERYKNMMLNGVKFDIPVLNIATRKQEGLHRSLAAYMISQDELIPVLIVNLDI